MTGDWLSKFQLCSNVLIFFWVSQSVFSVKVFTVSLLITNGFSPTPSSSVQTKISGCLLTSAHIWVLVILKQGFNYLRFLALPSPNTLRTFVSILLTLWTVSVLRLFLSIYTVVVLSVLCSRYTVFWVSLYLIVINADLHCSYLSWMWLQISCSITWTMLFLLSILSVGSPSSMMLISLYTS